MSTRAVHRNITPGPLHGRVTVPASVMLVFWPTFKLPLNPGAAMRQDGVGFPFGISDVAFMQVMLAGPGMFALSGCWPALSDVACSECTFPGRALCAPVAHASAKIGIDSTDSTVAKFRLVIAHLDLRELYTRNR
jgi:hypothetical protein